MKLITLLASSAALAGLALVTPAAISPRLGMIESAAAANVSVNVSLFYRDLERYGDWVEHDGDYVFVPVISDRHWRPYREGHWVYARGYGWTWVSRESFGWATYHYGRWGFDRDIGWYWVPGTRWAPAWVSWRRSGDHVAWAPLPPRHRGGSDIDISIRFSDIPDYYWVAVPTRHFLDRDLTVVVVIDDRERHRIVRDTEFVGTVNVQNNIIVNNIIDVNFVEKNTGKKVKEVAVKETDDPVKARSGNEEVAVFNGTVEDTGDAKPKKLKQAGEIRKNQAKVKQQVEAETGAQPDVTTPPDASGGKKKPKPADNQGATAAPDGGQTLPAGKTAKKVKPEQAQDQNAPDQEEPAQPADKKMRKQKPAAAQTEDQPPAADQAGQLAGKKKKKPMTQQDEQVQPDQQSGDQSPAKRKMIPAEPEPEQPGAADQSRTKPAKEDNKNKPCDPATDPDACQGQQ